MKRFFESIAIVAALAFAACACTNEALAPGEPSVPVPDVPGVSINIQSVGDNTFSFEVTPNAEVSWYSYVVTASPIAAPDSFEVYACRYDGVNIIELDESGKENEVQCKKRVAYATSRSYTVNVNNIDKNKDYYIYAVAANKENNVSAVASASVKTSDTVAPEIVDFDFEDNVVYLLFSENVTYVDGKEIVARVMAGNYLLGNPVIEKAVGNVVVKDNIAQITFPDIVIPGSYYTVNIPEGAFIDAVGQKTPAVESAFIQIETEEGPGVGIADGSIYGYIPEGEIEFEPSEATIILDWTAYTTLITCKTMINKVYPNKAVAIVSHEEDGVKTTTEYNLGQAPYYGALDYYTIGAKLHEEPSRGDKVTFVLLEGAVEDIYGNVNPEITIGPILYSYGFTIEDVLGTYMNDGTSAFGPSENEDPWTFTVSESDDPEQGDVIISNFYGLDCKMYAFWDGDGGVLSIPVEADGNSIGGAIDGSYYYDFYFVDFDILGGTYAGAPFELYMTEKGVFSDGGDYPGYWVDVYAIPESGNLGDIDPDNDYLGYGYNLFMPYFEGVEAGTSAAYAPKAFGLNTGRQQYRRISDEIVKK